MEGSRKRTILLVSLLGVAILFSAWLWDKPSIAVPEGFGQIVTDQDGGLLRLTTNQGEHYRLRARLDDISRYVVEATLLYEDRYFYHHFGVNPVALVGAALDSYVLGGRRRGASTVTMQLARMRFGLKTTDPLGKLVQILYALKLEAHYTKAQILEAYLNLAPYGGNVVGIRAASLIYFGKEPANLSLAEAMALSVIPQNPERRKPRKDGRVPPALRDARRRLAEAWGAARTEPGDERAILDRPLVMGTPAALPLIAPHLTTELLRADRTSAEIPTTIDARLQIAVAGRVRAYVAANGGLETTEAAALVVESDTMAVRALVGSADFSDAMNGQVDLIAVRRRAGDTLDPFVCALAAEGSVADEVQTQRRGTPAAELEMAALCALLDSAGVNGQGPEAGRRCAQVPGEIEVSMVDLVRLFAMLRNGGIMRPLRTRRDRATPATGAPLLSGASRRVALDMLAETPSPGRRASASAGAEDIRVAWTVGVAPQRRGAWSVGFVGPYVLAVWLAQPVAVLGGDPDRLSAAALFFDIVDHLWPVAASASGR